MERHGTRRWTREAGATIRRPAAATRRRTATTRHESYGNGVYDRRPALIAALSRGRWTSSRRLNFARDVGLEVAVRGGRPRRCGWSRMSRTADAHVGPGRGGSQPHLASETTTGVNLNYTSDEGEDRVRSAYGPGKYARLVALKGRVRPGQTCFRRNQNIKPSNGAGI